MPLEVSYILLVRDVMKTFTNPKNMQTESTQHEKYFFSLLSWSTNNSWQFGALYTYTAEPTVILEIQKTE